MTPVWVILNCTWMFGDTVQGRVARVYDRETCPPRKYLSGFSTLVDPLYTWSVLPILLGRENTWRMLSQRAARETFVGSRATKAASRACSPEKGSRISSAGLKKSTSSPSIDWNALRDLRASLLLRRKYRKQDEKDLIPLRWLQDICWCSCERFWVFWAQKPFCKIFLPSWKTQCHTYHGKVILSVKVQRNAFIHEVFHASRHVIFVFTRKAAVLICFYLSSLLCVCVIQGLDSDLLHMCAYHPTDS